MGHWLVLRCSLAHLAATCCYNVLLCIDLYPGMVMSDDHVKGRVDTRLKSGDGHVYERCHWSFAAWKLTYVDPSKRDWNMIIVYYIILYCMKHAHMCMY